MSRDDTASRVFVGNIQFEVTERELEEAFSKVGKVVNCKVRAASGPGAHQPPLMLFPFPFVSAPFCTFRCLSFPLQATLIFMWHPLTAISDKTSIALPQIITDKATQRSKGFGFVTFETPEAAQEAIDTMNDYPIQSRAVTVKVAENNERKRDTRDDFGGGLDRPRGDARGGNRDSDRKFRVIITGMPPDADWRYTNYGTAY